MKTLHSSGRRDDPAGFTLVEIMIVVVIIGLLCVMAVPALARSQQRSNHARFVSDLRTFAQALETYAAQNGTWPPNAGTGVVPVGMSSADFKVSVWTAPKNSVGGRWNWDRNNFGVAAAISVVAPTVTDAEMAAIDSMIDDGDLTTGLFRKVGARFLYILEE